MTIRKRVGIISALSVFLFGVMVSRVDLPYQADDYHSMLMAIQNPGFEISKIYTFSRMPVSVTVAALSLKTGILQSHPLWLLLFTFLAHAVGFASLFCYFEKRSSFFNQDFGKSSLWMAVLPAVIFTLAPNNYQIHLWHGCSPFAMGTLLIGLAWWIRNPFLRILGVTLGLLSYDTFPMLVLGLLLMELVLIQSSELVYRRVIRMGAFLFVCVALMFAAKTGLTHINGFLHAPAPVFNFSALTGNISPLLKTMFAIHFYKTNWILSLIEWIAIGGLAAVALKWKSIPRRTLALLFGIPLVAALPLILMPYSAERAFYGPQIIKALILSLLLSRILKIRIPAAGWVRFVTSCFIVAYLANWALILELKQRNADIVTRLESDTAKSLQACSNPCRLRVPYPSKGLNRDWILPEMFWASFYELIRMRTTPSKTVHFEIDPT